MTNIQPTTLNCPNPLCQATNPETNSHCDRCNNYLPKRYLWAVGLEPGKYKPGDLLDNRYIYKKEQILLDSKPSFLPDFPKDIYNPAFPYLALLAYRLQIPQPYGLLNGTTLLLESAPIYPSGATDTENQSLEGNLMPLLRDVWPKSNLLQQLNYFYQIIQLWIGTSALKVERSLIQLDNIFAGNGFIRLLEIYESPEESLSLIDLGHFWLYRNGFSEVPRFWEQLWTQMIQGEISSADEVLTLLDQAIERYGANVTFQAKIATLTDQGPSRTGNEDACYPKPRSQVSYSGNLSTWTIVCDGVGGHDGGEVASNLAIQQITHHTEVLNNREYHPYKPYEIVDIIKNAITSANDAICERNDIENRQDRQRMGTTTVLALLSYLNVYLAHIGDSRVYRITRSGCYQLSVDDDVASREVRQGNGFYRDLSHYPASGSLTQALGMNRSIWLRPSIQRFTVTEDCLFLLCSDGLSDFDRVEEFWRQELVPVLDGHLDISDACQRLIEVANTRNGHDNVTVSLIHYQLNQSQDLKQTTETTLTSPQPISAEKAKMSRSGSNDLSKSARGGVPVFPIAGLLLLLGVGGVWLYRVLGLSRVTPPLPVPTPSVVVEPLRVGQFVKLRDGANQTASNGMQSNGMQLRSSPELDSNPSAVVPIAPGSLLRILSRQEKPGQEVWLKLQVCNGLSPASANGVAKSDGVGWQGESVVQELVEPVVDLMPTQMGNCSPLASPLASPSPSTTPSAP